MPGSAVLPDWPPLAAARLVRVLSRHPVFDSFLIEISGAFRVLRVDRAAASALGLDRQGEFIVLLSAAAAGLGPAPMAVHAERGLLLLDYLPGRALAASELRQDRRLAQLGELLALVHQCPAVAETGSFPAVDFAAAARRYASLCGDEASSCEALAVEQRLPTLLATSPAPVLTHNDVHAGNVVVGPDDGLRLIDWEYAALGPSGFDLAAVLEQSSLPKSGEEQLVGEYERAGGSVTRADLPAWRAGYRGISRLWSRAVAKLA